MYGVLGSSGAHYRSIDNPDGIGGNLGAALRSLGSVGIVLVLVSLGASVLSVVVRLDKARGEERQQIKWFAYAAALLVGDFFFGVLPAQAIGGPGAVFVFIMIGLLAVPIAVGVAILRYQLYDIDVIINRTLVYGVLTAVLAALYFGGVMVTQAVLQASTGQEKPPQLAIAASTGRSTTRERPSRPSGPGCEMRPTSTPWARTWPGW